MKSPKIKKTKDKRGQAMFDLVKRGIMLVVILVVIFALYLVFSGKMRSAIGNLFRALRGGG